MKFLGLEVGSWADIFSSLATFLATAVALFVAFHKKAKINGTAVSKEAQLWSKGIFKSQINLTITMIFQNTGQEPVLIKQVRLQRFFLTKSIESKNIKLPYVAKSFEPIGYNVNDYTISVFNLIPYVNKKHLLLKMYTLDAFNKKSKSNFFWLKIKS